MHPIQQKLLQLSKIRDLSKLSYREIGRQLSEDSDVNARVHPQNVKYHFDQLIKDGAIKESDRPVARTQQVRNAANNVIMDLVRVPIVGSANCGPATIFADEKVEGYLEVSPLLLRVKNYNDLYALRASGDSMNNTQVMGKPINNGDFVIVDRSKITPRDGERVVVVRDNVANIKQIFFDHDEEVIVLRSESTNDYSPIYVSPNDDWDGLISGTVIQVIKDRALPQ
ncbi:MAG TPA: S24 family peptidase [Candidatus Saccharibacteria bacterium]|jgi:SOS-response transcriptional repressor LexA|nr:S24 family peptidase [Candidatus Saccharibacteria bacterium]